MTRLAYKRDGSRQTMWMPFYLPSRANFRGHTKSKHHTKMVHEQRNLTRMFFSARATKVDLPIRLTLIRIAPRKLDAHENLPMCFKSIVDGIADWLGVDDRSGIECSYDQQKAKTPNTYGCVVIVEAA